MSISAAGSALSSGLKQYSFARASAFTVTSGATGGVFEVTGSRVSYAISSAKNTTRISGNQFVALGVVFNASGLVTTTTTDNMKIAIQGSLDGGTTWSNIAVSPN